ncbi:MAG TPA: hypothetical protein PK535_08620 [Synergistaceae bacterium]|nr:hypothetical protein [Synergistaceae bacterium]
MKEKGKRIEALEREVARLGEKLEALMKERREEEALRREIRALRREVDDLVRRRRELTWDPPSRQDGGKKRRAEVPGVSGDGGV